MRHETPCFTDEGVERTVDRSRAKLIRPGILQPFKAQQLHTGFEHTQEYMWSRWDIWHAFMPGWGDPCTQQAMGGTAHVPTPFYTKCTQSRQGTKILSKAWFCTRGLMWTLLIIVAWTSGWGSLTDSIFTTLGQSRNGPQLYSCTGNLLIQQNLIHSWNQVCPHLLRV